jgi:hypothetical protein
VQIFATFLHKFPIATQKVSFTSHTQADRALELKLLINRTNSSLEISKANKESEFLKIGSQQTKEGE